MRLTNKLGFRRKTILDDEFGQLERATAVTKTGSEAVVKQLTPGVGGVLGFGKVKGGSEEEKKADALNDEANKVLETCGMLALLVPLIQILTFECRRRFPIWEGIELAGDDTQEDRRSACKRRHVSDG